MPADERCQIVRLPERVCSTELLKKRGTSCPWIAVVYGIRESDPWWPDHAAGRSARREDPACTKV